MTHLRVLHVAPHLLTFFCHLSARSPVLTWVASFLFTSRSSLSCSSSSDESDYHTDYEEEALESALSDLELSNHAGDHTEGEETADTVGSHLTRFCLSAESSAPKA